ncbi:ABC transporter-like protein [Candidatus Moduliflexus flocculans]|uniref:ABC transporter-like protein n=1 Tax=Candidatus Moduliflexus flocculans TaxID=1499966 RepID=A0A0S6VZ89_9BACT|nr:ABC transporter-like protein [Candidatus Moduliflexus flocculans]
MNTQAFIEVRALEKTFPGVRALKNVNFSINRNTVHCIVGENGAGKSTFIKILTGALAKSKGEILLNDKPFEPRSIREAMDRGISVLYQELNVVDELTVEENLTLGKEKHHFGLVKKSPHLDRVEAILHGLDETIRLNMLVGNLSVAQKQVIEITKAMSAECSVLVMDEPTAALSEEETHRLFQVVANLKQAGLTIIYISHKLSEIFEIGDYVTVFRDGEMVGTRSVAEIADNCGGNRPEACLELVKMMLGKIVVEEYIPSQTEYAVKLLEAKDLVNAKLRDVSFDLYQGEILGFYGLVGAGKTEVARVLYGLDDYQGELLIQGTPATFRTVRGALQAGCAMIPEERRADGIFGKLSVRANIPLMRMKSILTYGLLNRKKENLLADEYITKMSIAVRDREHKVALLSGGNQQKVVIAKCLNRDSHILLMDEPTRGVDVGAKQEIHNIIRDLAKQGKGIIVFSSELPEIVHLCDRIVLMHEGAVREIMTNRVDIDNDHIMAVVAGGEV